MLLSFLCLGKKAFIDPMVFCPVSSLSQLAGIDFFYLEGDKGGALGRGIKKNIYCQYDARLVVLK